MQTPTKLAVALCLLVASAACKKPDPPPAPEPSATPSADATPATSAEKPPEPKRVEPDPKRYAWLKDEGRERPPAQTALSAAIPTPPDYVRVALAPGSFGAWLRDLPIAPSGVPVKNYRGAEVHPGDDPYVEAVVAIDVGKADLQHSSDVILRLQMEWLWAEGRRDQTYKSATKDMLPYASYSEGKRILARGGHLYWVKKTEPNDVDDHSAFRDYADVVFTWVNSTAIRMQSSSVDPKEVEPGDFFLQPGGQGYSVIVLDVAEKPSGQRVALLGQALYPAMNVYVARPGRTTPWFSLRPPTPILTAHTKELKWEHLRRLHVQSSVEPVEKD